MIALTLRCVMLALMLLVAGRASADCAAWPDWEQFKRDYISDQGRVIDPYEGKNITTSEGQSYALFFALVANDRPAFDLLLSWTENNLAAGDLTQRLPAWLWGQESKSGKWQVLDDNPASDADLWIGWTLLQASHLWHSRSYQVTGTLLLNRVAKEEVADLKGFGLMLMPGKAGFIQPDSWMINPSYLPLQLLTRLSALKGPWPEINRNALRLLQETAPKGFAPDWYVWQSGSGWRPDNSKGPTGGYDAIRVYLWAGMLSDEDPRKATLLAHFAPMARLTETAGNPPERVNVLTGEMTNHGNVGFSAALLPFLQESHALTAQQQRVQQQPPGSDAYYSSVLNLFGGGWSDNRYRFNAQGDLLPAWDPQCVTSD
ncbi:MAG: cellulose synthase complex periplasmic endoglucanase BcsZ [Pantoea sp.]|nr:cellulose synthase complex periplasmic endoglucanase BcsZ [Pantoea sp.]